ncbi:MAG: hypothetical protein ABI432_08660 [Flavobacteriales bacterium]
MADASLNILHGVLTQAQAAISTIVLKSGQSCLTTDTRRQYDGDDVSTIAQLVAADKYLTPQPEVLAAIATALVTAAADATAKANAAQAAATAAAQPLDGDLTLIAALSTTPFGRSVLEALSAAALRSLAGVRIGTDVQAQNAELQAIASFALGQTGFIKRTGAATYTFSATVANSEMASMAAGTFKGRAAAAGSGSPTDLTPDQATTNLDLATDAFMRKSTAATTSTANAIVKALPTGKIDTSFIPDSVLGQLEYQGGWNAATNTPAIPAASAANKGWFHIVTVAVAAGHGYANIPNVDYGIGDWLASNGTTWDKVDNTDALVSFNGRIGAILPAAGDYTATQITNTPAGNIAAVTVQAALNELDSEKVANPGGANDDVLQRKGGIWTFRTIAQYLADLASGIRALVLSGYAAGANTALANTDTIEGAFGKVQGQLDAKQPLDSDLTAFAALTPANDDIAQRKGGVWTNRTIAQVLDDMLLTGISFASAVDVLATDAVRDAIGKLQAKFTALAPTLLSYSSGSQTYATAGVLANVNGTTFTFPSTGMYEVEYAIAYDANATTTGIALAVNGTAAFDFLAGMVVSKTQNADRGATSFMAFNDIIAAASTSGPTGANAAVKLTINVTTVGTILLRCGSEVTVASGIVISDVKGYMRKKHS